MSHYKSNKRDIEFNLFEVLKRDEVLGTGPFADIDTDTARSILGEVDRMALFELFDSFTDSDRSDTHTVSVAPNINAGTFAATIGTDSTNGATGSTAPSAC